MLKFVERMNNFTVSMIDTDKNGGVPGIWYRTICPSEHLHCTICSEKMERHEFMYACLTSAYDRQKVCIACIRKMENNPDIAYLNYVFVEIKDKSEYKKSLANAEFFGLSTSEDILLKIVSKVKPSKGSKYKMISNSRTKYFDNATECFKHYIRYMNGNKDGMFAIYKKINN